MPNQSAPQLTTKNLTILSDQLGHEALLVHKYSHAAQSVNDPAIRSQLYSISEQHRKHYDTLLDYLNSHQ
ncbi:MAG: ferritin-like domain-containing protein [Desulfitobacteriaceae bacterium]